MNLTITGDPALPEKRIAALRKLKQSSVKAGLPEKAGGRLHFILAVQEHGSPLMRIPARPVLKPAPADPDTRRSMAEEMRSAIESAWEGDDAAAHAALESAGRAGADGIRAYIDAGVPPPNSPITVEGGWMYNRAAKKAVYIRGKGMNKPLFDTGALYNAFSYEVED